MLNIPILLHQKLQTALLKCGPFTSNESLRASFAVAPLVAWQAHLPQTRTEQERVQATIDLLAQQKTAEGQNPLVIFLQYLSDNKDPFDSCHKELAALAHEVSQLPQIATLAPPTLQAQQLAEAMAKLAAMPTDELPEPTHLPANSYLPFSRNDKFTNRVSELQQLARLLKGQPESIALTPATAATGLGGIGKSQLAVEFAHRYGQYFAGGVFWLNFAADVKAEIFNCVEATAEARHHNDLETRVRLIRQAWQQPLPRLLIFDNCEDPQLYQTYRPTTGGCRVLITSRRHSWQVRGVARVQVATFAPAESVTLLQKFRADAAVADLAAIAEEVGHLPLALHLAGSYLEKYQANSLGQPATYLQKLRQINPLAHASLMGRGSDGFSPTDHDLHVARTFLVSYEDLDPTDPIDQTALLLLGRAACFAPSAPIPRALLLATLPPAAAEDEEAMLQQEDALLRLLDLGLLTEGEWANERGGEVANERNLATSPSRLFAIHRLIIHFVLQQAPDPTARTAVEQTLLDEAHRQNNAGYPLELQAWAIHLQHVTDIAQDRLDEMTTNLCNTLGYYLTTIADYPMARLYFERTLAICEKILGTEHFDTATTLNNLGSLLGNMGDYPAARPYHERALAIRERVLGAEHPDTATSLNNLGLLLKTMGDYAAARPYLERALAIREKGLGAEHPDTASSLNNLGVLLYAMGDYSAARPYFERTLAIKEKVLGAEHPDTATSLNNLGALLKNMGDYAAARPYYERALAIRERVLGAEHPGTATSLNNLGKLCYDEGDMVGAAGYMRRAVAILEKSPGPQHPNTQKARGSLAVIEGALAGGTGLPE